MSSSGVATDDVASNGTATDDVASNGTATDDVASSGTAAPGDPCAGSARATTAVDSSADEADPLLVAARARRAARSKKRKVRLIVAGVVLVGAFVFLLTMGLTNSLNYYETVNQALAQRAKLGDTTFRMEGVVAPGTIHPTDVGVDFTVESGDVREPVVETGQPPQLFQPGVPVVMVGHFDGTFFASNQILVDHTSQYVAGSPSRSRAKNGSAK